MRIPSQCIFPSTSKLVYKFLPWNPEMENLVGMPMGIEPTSPAIQANMLNNTPQCLSTKSVKKNSLSLYHWLLLEDQTQWDWLGPWTLTKKRLYNHCITITKPNIYMRCLYREESCATYSISPSYREVHSFHIIHPLHTLLQSWTLTFSLFHIPW